MPAPQEGRHGVSYCQHLHFPHGSERQLRSVIFFPGPFLPPAAAPELRATGFSMARIRSGRRLGEGRDEPYLVPAPPDA